MDVKRTRKILGKITKDMTDKEVQVLIDRVQPYVNLAVEAAKEKFKLE